MPDINKKYTGEGSEKSALIEIDEQSLGLNQFNSLSDFVNNEMKDGIKSFTFDLSKLNAINSSGLGILISCLKKIKDSGGSLQMVNVNDKLLNIFKLTKLDNVFDFKSAS